MTYLTKTFIVNTDTRLIIFGVLAVQLAVAFIVGYWQLLVRDTSGLLQPIVITAIAPVILFFLAYLFLPRLRTYVLTLDPRHLAMIHLWRVVGFAFLPVYAFGVLPGLFAWPAGLGDFAVGLAALFVVFRFEREPDYATSNGLFWFHVFGLLDLVVAVSAAALAGGVFPSLIPGGITSSAMAVWPMNIFPSFFVPFFLIAHVMAFLNFVHRRKTTMQAGQATAQPA